jgi:hypothetical protein
LEWQIDFTGEVRLLEKEYLHVIALGPESIVFDAATATYTLLLTLGLPGTYNLRIEGPSDLAIPMDAHTDTLNVNPPPWREVPPTGEPHLVSFLCACLPSTSASSCACLHHGAR